MFLRGFPIPAAVLTPEQLRAARILIRWTRKRLSDEAGVPLRTTEAFEQGRTSPMMRTEHKWRRALERAGVIFIDADDTAGPGVRLKARPKD